MNEQVAINNLYGHYDSRTGFVTFKKRKTNETYLLVDVRDKPKPYLIHKTALCSLLDLVYKKADRVYIRCLINRWSIVKPLLSKIEIPCSLEIN